MKTQIVNVPLTGGIDAKTSEPWGNKPTNIVNLRYSKTGSLTKRRNMTRGAFDASGDPIRDFQLGKDGSFKNRLEITESGTVYEHGQTTSSTTIPSNPRRLGAALPGSIIETPLVSLISAGQDTPADTCLLDTFEPPLFSDYCVEVFADTAGVKDEKTFRLRFHFYRIDEFGNKTFIVHRLYRHIPPRYGVNYVEFYATRVRVEYAGKDAATGWHILAVGVSIVSNDGWLTIDTFLVDPDTFNINFQTTKFYNFYDGPIVTNGTEWDMCAVRNSPNTHHELHVIYGVGDVRVTRINPLTGTDNTTILYSGSYTGLAIHCSAGTSTSNTKVVWSGLSQIAAGGTAQYIVMVGSSYMANAPTPLAVSPTLAEMFVQITGQGSTFPYPSPLLARGTTIACDSSGNSVHRLYNTQAGCVYIRPGLFVGVNQVNWFQNINAIGRPFQVSSVDTNLFEVPVCTMSTPYYGTGCFIRLWDNDKKEVARLAGVFSVDSIPIYQKPGSLMPTVEQTYGITRSSNNFAPVVNPARGRVFKLLTTSLQAPRHLYGFMSAVGGGERSPVATSVYKCAHEKRPPGLSASGVASSNCVNAYAMSGDFVDVGEIGFTAAGAILGADHVVPATTPIFPTHPILPNGTYQYVAVFCSVDGDGREQQSVPSLPFVFIKTDAAKNPRVFYAAYSVTARGFGGADSIPTIYDQADKPNVFVDIYRTKKDSATFFHHSRRPANGVYGGLPIHTGTTYQYRDGIYFEDFVLDDSLDILKSLNAGKFWQTPPNFKYSVIVNNKIFGVTYAGQVWPSETLVATESPRFDITRAFYWDGAENITAISYLDGKYFFFTENTISYAMEDQSGTLVSIQKIPTDTGCDNERSVIAGPFGVFFQNVKAKTILLLTRSMEVVRIGENLPTSIRPLPVLATALNASFGEIYFFITRGTPNVTPGGPEDIPEETAEWALVFDYFHGDVKSPVWLLDKYLEDDFTVRAITKVTRAYASNDGQMYMLGDAIDNTNSSYRTNNGYFHYNNFNENLGNWDGYLLPSSFGPYEDVQYMSWIFSGFESSFMRGPQTPSDDMAFVSASLLAAAHGDRRAPPNFFLSITGDYPDTPTGTAPVNQVLTHTASWTLSETQALQRQQFLVTATPEIYQAPAMQVSYWETGPTLFGGAPISGGLGFEIMNVVVRFGVSQTDDVVGLEAGARK